MLRNEIFFKEIAAKLPPVICRERVEDLLGGIISSKRLANLDSLGEGPPRFRIGRKIAYRTDLLLEWLSSRCVSLK